MTVIYKDESAGSNVWRIDGKRIAPVSVAPIVDDGDPLPFFDPVEIGPTHSHPELDKLRVHVQDMSIVGVTAVVGEKCSISVDRLLGHRGSRKLFRQRTVIWVLCQELGWSVGQIGRTFNRDHSTISCGIQRFWGSPKRGRTADGVREYRKRKAALAADGGRVETAPSESRTGDTHRHQHPLPPSTTGAA